MQGMVQIRIYVFSMMYLRYTMLYEPFSKWPPLKVTKPTNGPYMTVVEEWCAL